MQHPSPDADQLVAVAQKVFDLLSNGSFTNTYKYAVLLGILAQIEEGTHAEGAVQTMTSPQLAWQVLRIYWTHAVPFRAEHAQRFLAQQSGKSPRVISLIHAFREANGAPTWSEFSLMARRGEPAALRLMRDIEEILIKYPIPLLQRFGGQKDEFLYQWDHEEQPSGLTAYLNGRPGTINNLLTFRPGIPDALLKLAPLIRRMVQAEWIRKVSSLPENGLSENEVAGYLFGQNRQSLVKLREPLRQVQDGLCFYCRKPLASEPAEVDHFVPWSRHPLDEVENLVLAHRSCNQSKSDRLAAVPHVEQWAIRLEQPSLRQVAEQTRWVTAPETCAAVVQSVYRTLPDPFWLWQASDQLTATRRADVLTVLARLRGPVGIPESVGG